LIGIREEHPGDVAAIRDLNKRAFGQDQEGNIMDALRSNGPALLSLVATLSKKTNRLDITRELGQIRWLSRL
jgi:predicted N-acetyltransferase YhbS